MMNNYINKTKIFILSLMLITLIVINPFSESITKASETLSPRAVINNIITSMSVTEENGNPISGTINQWESFRVNANFAIPNNIVKEGDTSNIKLPNEIKFFDNINFEVKDSQGNVVANAVINAATKTVTLTYTDYVESHSDITGKFYFYATMDTKVVTTEKVIELKFDIDGKVITGGSINYKPAGIEASVLIKSGVQNGTDHQRLDYYIAINRKAATYSNVVIRDILQNPALEFIDGSFRIQKGIWQVVNNDWTLANSQTVTNQYQIVNSGNEFSVNLGNINGEGYIIRYSVRIKYKPVDGEVFKNRIEMKSSDKIIDSATLPVQIKEAGGTAEGYNFSVKVHKVDEVGKPLSGAIFTLTRDRNEAEIGRVTTDVNGNASFTGLLRDEYTLEEVVAPVGYALIGEKIKISPADFGTDKIVLKQVVNTLDKIIVEGRKTWNDNDNEAGLRPDKIVINLLANGVYKDSKTISATDNWQLSFVDLPKQENGKDIIYSIIEDTVPNYISLVEGYNVTNTYLKPINVEFQIRKTLEGRSLRSNEFLFVLEGTSDNTLGKTIIVKNDEVGNAKISGLAFDEVGEYEFVVYEKKGRDKKISYDPREYKIIVSVTADTTSNKLISEIRINGEVEMESVVLPFINRLTGSEIGGDKNN